METLISFFDIFRASSIYTVMAISGKMFWHLWYLLALGIVLGSLISVYLPRKELSSISQKSGLKGILTASLLGAISPLGSYAVIPIFSSMLAAGMPRAIVMTFLVTSPLIDPLMFILTWTVINPSMAFARLASAIILGILCGVTVDLLERRGVLLEETVQDVIGKSDIKGEAAHAVPANPHSKESEKERKPENRLREALLLMWMSAKYPGRYFLIAIVLAAVIATYVPNDAFVRYMGTGHTSIVIAAIMGIPLYMCGGGAIPLVHSFMCMGMNNGAALTFLVVGPATRIAPLVTVFSLVRKRIFLVYFLVVLLGGMVLGFLYGLI